jgi:uncharacterized membrane protein
MKQAGASVLGVGETADYPVILANLGGAWGIGVQTDVLGENLVAVFAPNSPNPLSGGVFLVSPDRVRPAGVSLVAAMGALRRCGTGAGALLSELAASHS